MDFILFVVFVVVIYSILTWVKNKLTAWAARESALVEGNGRVDDLAFFAAIGLAASAIQLIIWAVQAVAWAVHLLV